ncbi:hypothetical protein CYMTET_31481, partial [Cymbomonas tetramitiformis]
RSPSGRVKPALRRLRCAACVALEKVVRVLQATALERMRFRRAYQDDELGADIGGSATWGEGDHGGWRRADCRFGAADAACCTCGVSHSTARNDILFCDHCDRAYHQYCAGARKVPSGLWKCPSCSATGRHPARAAAKGAPRSGAKQKTKQKANSEVAATSGNTTKELPPVRPPCTPSEDTAQEPKPRAAKTPQAAKKRRLTESGIAKGAEPARCAEGRGARKWRPTSKLLQFHQQSEVPAASPRSATLRAPSRRMRRTRAAAAAGKAAGEAGPVECTVVPGRAARTGGEGAPAVAPALEDAADIAPQGASSAEPPPGIVRHQEWSSDAAAALKLRNSDFLHQAEAPDAHPDVARVARALKAIRSGVQGFANPKKPCLTALGDLKRRDPRIVHVGGLTDDVNWLLHNGAEGGVVPNKDGSARVSVEHICDATGYGVRAACLIPQGKLIGEYAGAVKTGEAHDAQFAALGEADKLEKLYYSKYTYEVGLGANKGTLVIDADKRRSTLAFMNDHCIIVDADQESSCSGETRVETAHQKIKYSKARPANVLFFEVECAGCPACAVPCHTHVLALAIRDLQPGEELLTDYGAEYHRKQAAQYSRLRIQQLQARQVQEASEQSARRMDADPPGAPSGPAQCQPSKQAHADAADKPQSEGATANGNTTNSDVDDDLMELQALVYNVGTSEPNAMSHEQIGKIYVAFLSMLDHREGSQQVRCWKKTFESILSSWSDHEAAKMTVKSMLNQFLN